ncbi:MAG: amidohydrolase family protein [Novosphingobium sp.]
MRVDLVLRNVRPFGSAPVDIAIRDGRVTAIGAKLSASGPHYQGEGRDIIPGLADHHIHLFATAAKLQSIDLSDCLTEVAIRQSLIQAATQRPDGQWLRATGLIEPDGIIPDAAMLDRWIDDRPLRVQDRTGALWVLNSAALERLGSGPWPDCVERDAHGKPTGRIWRGDAWLRTMIADLPPSLAAISQSLAKMGVSAVTDAGAQNGPEEARLFNQAITSGALQQRLTVMGREDLPLSPHYKRGALKLLYDESDLPPIDEISTRIAIARTQSRAVAAHVVTVGELLFFLAALGDSGGAMPGDRIEHGSLIPHSLLGDIAATGLTIVPQPDFVRTRGDRYLKEVDPIDWPDLHRLGSLQSAGIAILGGSDAPYGAFDPWQAINAAIKRTTISGQSIGAEEALNFQSALGLFLSETAIRVGQAADFCLLDVPLVALQSGVTNNPVGTTFIDGQFAVT